ncbi:hypothetical protein CEXT_461741 [Caerostris extrusa]|uniref:Uncharacterized protein n=1 Tax=Caerostris extrusa TaxID=172846 RepID=A0AAV4Y3F4_CAEEX|nr:hypothetical protein CEXT_461741 [Caerostris extrusa]
MSKQLPTPVFDTIPITEAYENAPVISLGYIVRLHVPATKCIAVMVRVIFKNLSFVMDWEVLVISTCPQSLEQLIDH